MITSKSQVPPGQKGPLSPHYHLRYCMMDGMSYKLSKQLCHGQKNLSSLKTNDF